MTSSRYPKLLSSLVKNGRKIVRIAQDVLYLSHGRFLLKTLSRSVRYYYSVVSIGEDPDGDDDALRFSSSSLSGDKPLPLVLLRKRGETETF